MTEEVRVVDPDTGGEKGQKLERFDLLPVGPLTQVARHYGVGARKYEDRNWERGYPWSLSYGALMRHVTQWWGGEDIDEETGSHHMAAVVFHALALLEFAVTHPEKDDRPYAPEDDIEYERTAYDDLVASWITATECPRHQAFVVHPNYVQVQGFGVKPDPLEGWFYRDAFKQPTFRDLLEEAVDAAIERNERDLERSLTNWPECPDINGEDI